MRLKLERGQRLRFRTTCHGPRRAAEYRYRINMVACEKRFGSRGSVWGNWRVLLIAVLSCPLAAAQTTGQSAPNGASTPSAGSTEPAPPPVAPPISPAP